MNDIELLANLWILTGESNNKLACDAMNKIRKICDAMPQTIDLDSEQVLPEHTNTRSEFRNQWQEMLSENWDNMETA